MKLIDIVKHDTGTIPKFMKYLIDNKYDYNKIITSDNILEVIFYYISYLESESVYILVDHNGFVVYKQFNPKQQHIIACEFIDKPIVAKYILSIVSAFNYLENPF